MPDPRVLTIPEDVAVFCKRIGATLISVQTNGGLLVQQWTAVFTTPGNGEKRGNV